MSTVILPDRSVVVRMPAKIVHFDVRSGSVLVLAASHDGAPLGRVLASFGLEDTDRVRIVRGPTAYHLYLDLRDARSLDLGDVPSPEDGMITARAIADVTRCRIEHSECEDRRAGDEDDTDIRDLHDEESGLHDEEERHPCEEENELYDEESEPLEATLYREATLEERRLLAEPSSIALPPVILALRRWGCASVISRDPHDTIDE